MRDAWNINMRRARKPSPPAPSDDEVDIVGELLGGGPSDREQDEQPATKDTFDADELIRLGHDSDDDDAFIALKQAASFRKKHAKATRKSFGAFQVMGLNANLLRAITRKGFSVPTPIQRKTIPLILDQKDVVGMARTGSGKTAAFVIPMIERLRAHSSRVGARALILSPSRELALQTLKVVKDLRRGTDLRCVLLVGGDSVEEQFGLMASNPDIVIATPGRFLHLKVEMSLDLSSLQYVVFDEADRLFEMGFATQLCEILHALPQSRQTLLFSATLPKSLVEFATAGLQEPSLVRLDVETKISPDLQSAFFPVKGSEKEGALLHILHDVIQVPLGLPPGVLPRNDDDEDDRPTRKRKWGADGPGKPTEHSTIIFAATKHHVEYLLTLLRHSGFAVSHVYGSLDQTARKIQVEDFRWGRSNILVVTDVAARGIDIPILAYVINYDFPPQPKIFLHRVGRTARAGQRGWSYSLVRDSDAPYLLDLQLFLGRRLVLGQEQREISNFSEDMVLGALRRDDVDRHVEWVADLLRQNDDFRALRTVVTKAEKLYFKTRNSASAESAKRAREIVSSKQWMQLHPLFGTDSDNMEQARADMLARISGYRPQETIFEVGKGRQASANEAACIMKDIRKKIKPRRSTSNALLKTLQKPENLSSSDGHHSKSLAPRPSDEGLDSGSESELEATVSNSVEKSGNVFRDSEMFMPYTPRTVNAAEEKAYGVRSGGNFVEAARNATMDLANDETKAFGIPTRPRMRWDHKSKKYVSSLNEQEGSRGTKMIKGESGVKIAASFRSGRFEKWKRAHRLVRLPRVGEEEKSGIARLADSSGTNVAPNGYRYKHKKETAPKDADKYRDDYHVRKRRIADAKEKRIGRFKNGAGSRKEIKDEHDILKGRLLKQRRKERSRRHAKKASRP